MSWRGVRSTSSADVLLRAGLVHVGPDDDLLLVVSHHIGSDHASSGILFAELEALYSGTSELPELPIQYADFAIAQRERVSGKHLEELLDYWTTQLAGVPDRLDLPTDRPRPAVQSHRGALYESTIDPAVVTELRALARANGVSLFMVLLAAFETVLCRYTGAEDFVVGAPISGRHEERTQQLIGYLSNTLALRADVSGDPTFAELLARVKATTLAGQIYQELPFEKLVEVLNPERALSHTPLFQVLLGFDVAPGNPPTLAGKPLEELPVPGLGVVAVRPLARSCASAPTARSAASSSMRRISSTSRRSCASAATSRRSSRPSPATPSDGSRSFRS